VLEGHKAMSSHQKKKNPKTQNKITNNNTIQDECTLYYNFKKEGKNQKQKKETGCL